MSPANCWVVNKPQLAKVNPSLKNIVVVAFLHSRYSSFFTVRRKNCKLHWFSVSMHKRTVSGGGFTSRNVSHVNRALADSGEQVCAPVPRNVTQELQLAPTKPTREAGSHWMRCALNHPNAGEFVQTACNLETQTQT